jgi:alpha-tubulin suppressor-like RCC1 family protein
MHLFASQRLPAAEARRLGVTLFLFGLTLLMPVPALASQAHRGHAAAHRLIAREQCTLKRRNKSPRLPAAPAGHQACVGRAAHPGSPATGLRGTTGRPPAPQGGTPPPAPGTEVPPSPEAAASELLPGELAAPVVPGAVASWGLNLNLDLGAGFKDGHMATPVATLNVAGALSISVGYNHGLALLSDGTVATWGGNAFGSLGNGERVNADHAVRVQGLTGAVGAAAGGAQGIAVLKDGTVETWGGDGFGELGNGTYGVEVNPPSSSTVPLTVPGLSGVVAVAAGGADDAALLANGTVMMWGENKNGQIGDGTTVDKHVPTLVKGLTGVKAIALGGVSSLGGHSLALLNDGTVMAWGANGQGQLGSAGGSSSVPIPVRGLTGVTAISASVSHSLALVAGQVWGWGSDSYHQLGTAPSEQCGELVCTRTPAPTGLNGATAVSAGWGWSMALQAGHIMSWGLNRDGQLGNGTFTDSASPVEAIGIKDATAIAAGERHSSAIVAASLPPTIEAVPGPDSITVNWLSPELTEGWQVAYRLRTPRPSPLSKFQNLPPSARTYTVGGLNPVAYEVIVRNKIEGNKIVRGVALP